jgi:hypothetical protein
MIILTITYYNYIFYIFLNFIIKIFYINSRFVTFVEIYKNVG